MKATKLALAFSLATIITSSAYAEAPGGETLYKAKCASCHIMKRPADTSTMIAPPIMGVTMHVKMNYDTKEKAVAFIKSYVQNPDRSKAVCEPSNIKRFGLMPSQKGNVTEDEVGIIASWMYDTFAKGGAQQQKRMHQKNGIGKQQGQGKHQGQGKKGCGRN